MLFKSAIGLAWCSASLLRMKIEFRRLKEEPSKGRGAFENGA
jgi:hypothetical protein